MTSIVALGLQKSESGRHVHLVVVDCGELLDSRRRGYSGLGAPIVVVSDIELKADKFGSTRNAKEESIEVHGANGRNSRSRDCLTSQIIGCNTISTTAQNVESGYLERVVGCTANSIDLLILTTSAATEYNEN